MKGNTIADGISQYCGEQTVVTVVEDGEDNNELFEEMVWKIAPFGLVTVDASLSIIPESPSMIVVDRKFESL